MYFNIQYNIFNQKKMNKHGFIILRYVISSLTNKYWIECYESIRRLYPENLILIIDDNSNYDYVSDLNLYKTTIIQNEYPQRGELMPYIYYLKNKLFDTACILHDSVFLNKYIEFNIDKYQVIWEIGHTYDNTKDEIRMLKRFNNNKLLEFYLDKKKWNGCFGGMTIITHDYLTYINNKYDLSKLIDVVSSRKNRSSFERVIVCFLQIEHKRKKSLFGNIKSYIPWGINYHEKDKFKYLPMVKVWTGR